MTGIYFSGTGNTKRCVERFLNGIESGAETFALETPQATEAVKCAQEICLPRLLFRLAQNCARFYC